jgi:tRNA(fMet)-specific endonuclease VapC
LLLDTTFLIDGDRSTIDLDGVISDDDDVAVTAVTVAELLVGVELADQMHKAERRQFVDDVRARLPVVDYDSVVAEFHAGLLAATRRQGRPRGAHDLIIAATAAATRREIVSADQSGYTGLAGVTVRSHRR